MYFNVFNFSGSFVIGLDEEICDYLLDLLPPKLDSFESEPKVTWEPIILQATIEENKIKDRVPPIFPFQTRGVIQWESRSGECNNVLVVSWDTLENIYNLIKKKLDETSIELPPAVFAFYRRTGSLLYELSP
jgi:hypothetical protein